MDQAKCGALIKSLRREKGWTQAELARRIGVTDKAVSKWERALGCPDISLLDALSREFRVDMAALVSGTLNESKKDGGNMNRLKFYLCPVCGSLLTSTGRSDISCCGRQARQYGGLILFIVIQKQLPIWWWEQKLCMFCRRLSQVHCRRCCSI